MSSFSTSPDIFIGKYPLETSVVFLSVKVPHGLRSLGRYFDEFFALGYRLGGIILVCRES